MEKQFKPIYLKNSKMSEIFTDLVNELNKSKGVLYNVNIVLTDIDSIFFESVSLKFDKEWYEKYIDVVKDNYFQEYVDSVNPIYYSDSYYILNKCMSLEKLVSYIISLRLFSLFKEDVFRIHVGCILENDMSKFSNQQYYSIEVVK